MCGIRISPVCANLLLSLRMRFVWPPLRLFWGPDQHNQCWWAAAASFVCEFCAAENRWKVPFVVGKCDRWSPACSLLVLALPVANLSEVLGTLPSTIWKFIRQIRPAAECLTSGGTSWHFWINFFLAQGRINAEMIAYWASGHAAIKKSIIKQTKQKNRLTLDGYCWWTKTNDFG